MKSVKHVNNYIGMMHQKCKMNNLIIFIMIVQNLSIFFADVVHAITLIQLICLVFYCVYLFVCRGKLWIQKEMSAWFIYVGVVVCNYFVGGDGDFIKSFVVFNLSMLLLMNFDGAAEMEYSIMKGCSVIHLIASLMVYLLPQTVVNIIFYVLLRDGFNSNYAWRVISNVNPGMTTQPGINAMFLCVCVMTSAVEMFEKKEKRGLNFVLFLLSSMMILTTGKRSVIMFTVPVIMLYYVLVHGNRLIKISFSKFVKYFVFLGGVILFGIWIFNYTSMLQTVIEKMNGLIQAGDVSNGRFELWRYALRQFKIKPIFGVGLKNIYAEIGLDVHNTYIQILTELGVIGAVSFLIAISNIFYISTKRIKQLNRIESVSNRNVCVVGFGYMLLIFLVVYGVVGNTFIDYVPVMLFCMTIVMINAPIKEGKNNE